MLLANNYSVAKRVLLSLNPFNRLPKITPGKKKKKHTVWAYMSFKISIIRIILAGILSMPENKSQAAW